MGTVGITDDDLPGPVHTLGQESKMGFVGRAGSRFEVTQPAMQTRRHALDGESHARKHLFHSEQVRVVLGCMLTGPPPETGFGVPSCGLDRRTGFVKGRGSLQLRHECKHLLGRVTRGEQLRSAISQHVRHRVVQLTELSTAHAARARPSGF